MNFTDSRYEQEMKQKPQPQEPDGAGPPAGCRCDGCPYWRGIVCVSCFKELLKDRFSGR